MYFSRRNNRELTNPQEVTLALECSHPKGYVSVLALAQKGFGKVLIMSLKLCELKKML
jgi:hypothetical protein